MISMPEGFAAALGTLATAGGSTRTGLAMLDGTDGAARLVFGRGARRRTAALGEWLAIIRVQPSLERGPRMLWVLDTRTIRWPGTAPLAGPGRAMTGLGAAVDPMLWFRAAGGAARRRGLTLSGVFRAGGIVDAARVRVTAPSMRDQVRLRLAVDPQMWGLPSPAWGGGRLGPGAAARLTITATGDLRPLEFAALRRWL